ncbi:MAG: stage II sporulation protein R [Bacillota bacterium]|nr:stage II sporulation protein R [Bacillota bacterium]
MAKSKFKVWELSLLIALCLSLCAGTWAQARQNAISGSLVRLHVLAVSDEENEQSIKLDVRDAVLEYISPCLESAQSSDEAKRIVNENLGGIKRAAESAARGRKVTVTLSEEYYPTREYEGFSLPAGRYDSLRVILGDGKGHNWWCVVFPPLCVSAAEQQEALDAMSDDTRSIVAETDGYQIKFRIVELWNEFLELFE